MSIVRAFQTLICDPENDVVTPDEVYFDLHAAFQRFRYLIKHHDHVAVTYDLCDRDLSE